MFGRDTELQVMIVRGPSSRSDFHIELGEEWFYQLKGNMILQIALPDNMLLPIVIREGQTFLLPARVPHSPRRMPDSFGIAEKCLEFAKAKCIGIVIERQRGCDELDQLRWYCGSCSTPIYEAALHCTDLETQLEPVITSFLSQPELKRCPKCGSVDCDPRPVTVIDKTQDLIFWPYADIYPLPFNLQERISTLFPPGSSGRKMLFSESSCVGPDMFGWSADS